MFRGTTPKVSVILPQDIKVTDISEMWVTLSQGRRKLTKKLNDFFVGKSRLYLKLTQKETLVFEAGKPLFVQVRMLLEDGSAVASRIAEHKVRDVLTGGEIKKRRQKYDC